MIQLRKVAGIIVKTTKFGNRHGNAFNIFFELSSPYILL